MISIQQPKGIFKVWNLENLYSYRWKYHEKLSHDEAKFNQKSINTDNWSIPSYDVKENDNPQRGMFQAQLYLFWILSEI